MIILCDVIPVYCTIACIIGMTLLPKVLIQLFIMSNRLIVPSFLIGYSMVSSI